MTHKKPIALYDAGLDTQQHNVVQGQDVIDASHLAVHSRVGNKLTVAQDGDVGNNSLLVAPPAPLSREDIDKYVKKKTLSAAISPHLNLSFAKPQSGYSPAPLPQPSSWVADTLYAQGSDEGRPVIIPAYDVSLFDNNIAADSTFTDGVVIDGVTIGAKKLQDLVQGVQRSTSAGTNVVYFDNTNKIKPTDYFMVRLTITYMDDRIEDIDGPFSMLDLLAFSRTHHGYVKYTKLQDMLPNGQLGPTKLSIVTTLDSRLQDSVTQDSQVVLSDRDKQIVLRDGDETSALPFFSDNYFVMELEV